jgi:hypothetical protein
MSVIKEGLVLTGAMMIVWDGVTRPETVKNNVPLDKPVYSLKLAGNPHAPEVAEINAISQAALVTSQFKGVMPHNGKWPVATADPQLAEGKLAGMVTINPKTRNGAPYVCDANGQQLPPAVYGPMLYPGCLVKALVTAYAFNNESKGITLSLEGIQIVDATAPRLPIGQTVDAAAAFAAAGAGMPGAVPPVPGMAVPPVPGAMPPPAPPAPPAKTLTALAGGASYDQMIAAGWTDATLIQNGYMVA